MTRRLRNLSLIACTMLLAGAYATAPAVAGLISPNLLHVEAVSLDGDQNVIAEGNGDISLVVNPDVPGGWKFVGNYDITDEYDGSFVLGSVTSVTASYDGDPQVSLGFTAQAGSGSPTTTFTFTSAIVTFAQMLNMDGAASAGVSLTDRFGTTTGAQLNGLYPGTKAYQAYYGSSGTPNTPFGYLVSPVTSTGSPRTVTGAEDFPVSGTQLIAGPIDSIQAQWSFTLTKGDLASGTSTFDVEGGIPTPEPSSIALLVVGVLGCLLAKSRRMLKRKGG